MTSRTAAVFLGFVFALATLPAQEPAPAPLPTATLLAASHSFWQCEPIRCTLRATAQDGDATVRSYYSSDPDPWSPLQIERRGDGDDWRPVSTTRGARHPARGLIPPPGKPMRAGQTFDYEVELWDLDVLAEPGTLRMRVVLKANAEPKDDAKWAEVASPWVQFEIRAHAGNAAQLLGEDAAARRAVFDRMSVALNTTTTTIRNTGPHNPGPGSRANPWEPYAPLAQQLVDDAKVSFRLRARARLVLAYSAIHRAQAAIGEARTEAIRVARSHLDATELAASPPSGGLDALPSGGWPVHRLMLLACADGMEGTKNPRLAHQELCERYPFFAMWWRHEAADLLLR